MTLLAQNPSFDKSRPGSSADNHRAELADIHARAEALGVIRDFGDFYNPYVDYHVKRALARLSHAALKTETLIEIARDLEASERFVRRLNGRA